MPPTIPTNIAGKPLFWKHRFRYTLAAAGFTFIAYMLFFFIGLVPSQFRHEPVPTANSRVVSTTSVQDLSSAVPQSEQPSRIVIDKIGINTTVKNPVSTDIQTLNNYLQEGAVRWPTSGDPGHGNLFIFGHSTGLETVVNQAYKTFNNLESLTAGDTITVETNSGRYLYKVTKVQFKKDAAAFIPFDSGKNMLTLSTCNNFGAKEDRIIVRAEFASYVPYAQ